MTQEVTTLDTANELRFKAWAKQNEITDVDDPRSFYDYRGYWKDVASKGSDQRKQYEDGLHFPDTYKQHGHPTFSVESKYSEGANDGGTWDGETYVPQKAEMAQEVVIVGSDGTEHVFPAGFDPKRAADIVRKQTAQAPEVPADRRGALERFVTPILPSTTPADYINGPMYALRHPIDSAKLIAGAVKADPVGAIPVVGNLKRAAEDIGSGNYAGAAGETLMAALPLALKRVRVPVGEATSATGRAIQAVAESKPVQSVSGLASAGEMVLKGDLTKAAIAAAAPTLAKYAGKGVEWMGNTLQGSEAAVARARAANPKIALKALDVIRIKSLIDQGVSQADATKTVLILKAKGLAK